MHDCPNCGSACYCSGDIDDSPAMTENWVYANCTHCDGEDEFWDDFDEYQ